MDKDTYIVGIIAWVSSAEFYIDKVYDPFYKCIKNKFADKQR